MNEKKIDLLLEGIAVLLEKHSTDYDKEQIINKICNILNPKEEPTLAERTKEALSDDLISEGEE